MRAGRVLVVPALVVAAALTVFHRAFAPIDLVIAAVTAVLAGGATGVAIGVRRLPWPAGLAAGGVVMAAGAAALTGRIDGVTSVPDAFALFLTVGLPATGLRDLSLVPYALGAAGTAAAVAASRRGRPLSTIAPVVAVTAVGSLLVLPVGFAWPVPVVVAVAGALVLLLDARTDLSAMAPLVGTNTEVRRQVAWWRPLVQFVPAVLAVVALTAILPRGRTIDVRQFVEPATERLADANPLAVAGRATRLAPTEARPLADVAVDGPSPGRLRLAVLDRYRPTGWQQAADFSITGETLADDPLYRAEAARRGDAGGPGGAGALAPAETAVEVRPDPDYDDLRTVPTGGTPRSVDEPALVRYAPSAGVLLAADPALEVRYRAAAPEPPSVEAPAEPTVGRYPPELATCPDSEPVRAIAAQLAAGTTDATERLGRIERFLKVRRVYDPASPGGQTLRSVERFLAQDYGRGNLEVFVSASALLARCAGVPVRVVVGLPAPAADATTSYASTAVTAWVETPLATAGWRAFDPLPTPDEQAQQAQLARQSEPPPVPEPDPAEPARPPRVVEPSDRAREAPVAATVLAVVVALSGLALLVWTVGGPLLVARRRRRAADPADAVMAAWSTVAEALVDRGLEVDVAHTPSEVARLAGGRLPLAVPRLIEGLAPLVDRVRYSGQPATPDAAAEAWAYANAIVERLPSDRRHRLGPLFRPGRALERWRSTRGVARRRAAWRGTLPDTALLRAGAAPDDVPGVVLSAKVGEGSTGTVYRGVSEATRTPVAVKVFRYGPGDAGFDEHRFDWEVRIARTVSGLPHLPVVHDAGITPTSHRPFLVSTLYDHGTLLDRVRRGGTLTVAEAVHLGADLAAALATLHQLGVVHADVKPENVFVDHGGWVLGDLGSAWLRASRGPAATMTPPYAAPEVWRGAPPSVSSDIYSLALTMLFAVTGQVPTASITPTREDVDAVFGDHPVVARALEPDARRRPRLAVDLARALRPELAPSHTGPGLTTLRLPTPTVTHGGR
jgi:hypothetical protein